MNKYLEVGSMGHIIMGFLFCFVCVCSDHTIFHNDLLIYIPTNNIKGPPSLSILTNASSLVNFLVIAILKGDRHLTVVLNHIVFIIRETVYIFMYLLDICISSFEKHLQKSFAHILK